MKRAMILLAACSSPPAAIDALPPIDVASIDASPPAWVSVTPVANDGTVIVEDLTYRSGALTIHAHQCRPTAAGPHPLVIYNHGGFQGLALDPEVAATCAQTAQLGDVWLGSSYRGEDGSDGAVEICLGEVDDVLAMIAIARAQPYVEPARVVMWGGSHGGCITERAVQRGAPVIAAVDLFGPTNWATLDQYWKDQIAANATDKATLQQLVAVLEAAVGGPPSSEFNPQYVARSPLAFVGDFPVGVPLLIVHGTADTIVPVAQSCSLAMPLGLASWHLDETPIEIATVPAGCTGSGVPSLTTARPRPTWPGGRYFVVYDGLGHETASAAAQTMLQDAATFLMAKL